jgi:hypothetical protein
MWHINKSMHRNLFFLCIHIIKYKKKKLNCLSDKFLFLQVYNTNFVFFSKWDKKREVHWRINFCLFYSIWAVWWFDILSIGVKSFLSIDITFCKIFFDFKPPKTNILMSFYIYIYFLRSTYRRAKNLSNSSSNITGKEIFITAHHSSNESGHIWNTV